MKPMSNPTPPAPSAWQLEQSVAAWQRLQAAETDDGFIDTDEALVSVERLHAYTEDPHALLGQLIDAAIWAERRVEEAQAIKRRIDARRARYETRADRYREQIRQLLAVLDLPAWEGDEGAASFRKGTPSVIVTDIDKLEAADPDLVKVEKTPKKTEIAKLLKDGFAVPGAEMSTPAPSLRITAF
jgi:hypothetical protein